MEKKTMHRQLRHVALVMVAAALSCAAAGCVSSCGGAFAEYDGATEVATMELKRCRTIPSGSPSSSSSATCSRAAAGSAGTTIP